MLVFTELKSEHPMIDLHFFRNVRTVAALLVSLLVISAQMSTFYMTTQLLQSMGPNLLWPGLGFLPMSVGVFLMSRFAPRLVVRFGATTLVGIGAALQALALVLMAWRLGAESNYFATAFAPLIDGFGLGLVLMPVTTLAMRNVPADRAGSVSGMLQVTQQLGAAIGLGVVVTVYTSHGTRGKFLPSVQAVRSHPPQPSRCLLFLRPS